MTPCTHSRLRHEAQGPARREHAPDAAGPALRADDGSSTTGPSRCSRRSWPDGGQTHPRGAVTADHAERPETALHVLYPHLHPRGTPPWTAPPRPRPRTRRRTAAATPSSAPPAHRSATGSSRARHARCLVPESRSPGPILRRRHRAGRLRRRCRGGRRGTASKVRRAVSAGPVSRQARVGQVSHRTEATAFSWRTPGSAERGTRQPTPGADTTAAQTATRANRRVADDVNRSAVPGLISSSWTLGQRPRGRCTRRRTHSCCGARASVPSGTLPSLAGLPTGPRTPVKAPRSFR